jgi:hypothetical protein
LPLRRRAATRIAALGCLLALAAGDAAGQLSLTGELGLARYTDDPFGRGDLGVFAASAAYQRRWLVSQAAGALARLEGGDVGVGGQAFADVRLLARRGLALEIGGYTGAIGSFTGYDDITHVGGLVRGTLRRGDRAVSLALQRGQTWTDTRDRPIWTAQLRATLERRTWTAGLGLTGHSYRLFDPIVDFDDPGAERRFYEAGDAELTARAFVGRLEIGASGVARAGRDETDGVGGQVDAAFWLTDRLALTASAGRQLEDLIRGVGTTRYLTAAVRVASRPRYRPPTADAVTPGVLRAQREQSGLVTLRVLLPTARTLELSGDLTGWTPQPFVARGGGEWELVLGRVESGPTRVQWRVDGGEWTAPPGLPLRESDFEGSVAVLVLPM